MKKLLIALMFLPLIGFGQEGHTHLDTKIYDKLSSIDYANFELIKEAEILYQDKEKILYRVKKNSSENDYYSSEMIISTDSYNNLISVEYNSVNDMHGQSCSGFIYFNSEDVILSEFYHSRSESTKKIFINGKLIYNK